VYAQGLKRVRPYHFEHFDECFVPHGTAMT
jgi:hypothetical protein